jgi:hypothetical protein
MTRTSTGPVDGFSSRPSCSLRALKIEAARTSPVIDAEVASDTTMETWLEANSIGPIDDCAPVIMVDPGRLLRSNHVTSNRVTNGPILYGLTNVYVPGSPTFNVLVQVLESDHSSTSIRVVRIGTWQGLLVSVGEPLER